MTCGANALCIDLETSEISHTRECPVETGYKCVCNHGYAGDGVTCLKMCGANATCINTGNCERGPSDHCNEDLGFKCVCNHGYEGDGVVCISKFYKFLTLLGGSEISYSGSTGLYLKYYLSVRHGSQTFIYLSIPSCLPI
ncbi:pro-epidermal growth factor-like [Lingula anatina]|uniref:Pro-epidermal growth factor-like n=1 Tax=Lingula anatina TaxID=7574 RepID=A0A1S3HWP1_LINAN|nr:pro-epidermal growth factor-like [Lingula anatina]|eukprot:XP_013389479.1 pro-epidermal growth factor-like [Lingula anatina]